VGIAERGTHELFPFSRTFPISGAEGSQEDGVIAEPGVLSGFQHWHAPPDRLCGILEAFLADVLMNGAAISIFKPVHKVVTAKEEGTGESIDAEVFPEVEEDIASDLFHFGIEAVGGQIGGIWFRQYGAVQLDEELQSAGIGHQRGAEGGIVASGLDIEEQIAPVLAIFAARPE